MESNLRTHGSIGPMWKKSVDTAGNRAPFASGDLPEEVAMVAFQVPRNVGAACTQELVRFSVPDGTVMFAGRRIAQGRFGQPDSTAVDRLYLVVGHLPLGKVKDDGYAPVHDEVEYAGYEYRQSRKLSRGRILGRAEELGNPDRLGERGVFDKSHHLVGARWKNSTNHLRQYDTDEGLGRTKAENLRGFPLALRNGVDTSAVDLGEVGGVVYDKGNDDGCKTVIGNADQVVGCKVHEDDLKYQGCPTHDEYVEADGPPDELRAGSASKGDGQGKRYREKHGQKENFKGNDGP